MKKLATLFTDSYQELKQVKTLTIAALLVAVSVVLGYFTIPIGEIIRISFSPISNQIFYYLFGPVAGGVFGGVVDILKVIVKPNGPFFPGFTITAIIGGVLYGIILYKKPLNLARIMFAQFIIAVVCNIGLNTYWVSILNGKGFLAVLGPRILSNMIMWLVNSILFYIISKSLEKAGVFRMIKEK